MQFFIFIFSSKPCSVFLQLHPKDTLCTNFQAKWRIQVFQLKFVQKMDLGLEFQKTNTEVRINIFEILCLYVHVCQSSGKTNRSDFFSPNFPKNGFRVVGNSKNYCRNKNQHPWYTMCQFLVKMNNFDFFSPNLSKKGFRVWNWEKQCRNKNQHHRDTLCTNFQPNWTTLTFLAQI